MEDKYLYSSNLNRKIDSIREPEIVDALCCWSDLLGFGRSFTDCEWSPDIQRWNSITKRLVDAQKIHFRNIIVGMEFSLVLNDGMIRAFNLDKGLNHMQYVSLWLRSCIYFHVQTNMHEKSRDLPGTRTVLAAGKKALHNWESIHFDDFVFNYTKPDPNKMSSIAEHLGNPVLISNPSALQMNTAFSKCFIIDGAGSKYNVSGANFFIDKSVLELLKEYSVKCNDHCGNFIWEEREDHFLFAIPFMSNPKRYHLGFEFFKPSIELDTGSLKTTVWKLKNFYPHDEDPSEFKISLNHIDNTDVPPAYL